MLNSSIKLIYKDANLNEAQSNKNPKLRCSYCLVSVLQKFPAFLLNSARLTLDPFQVVGDELLVSNPKRIERAIQEVACNALLLKVPTDLSMNFLVEAILMLWMRFPSLTDLSCLRFIQALYIYCKVLKYIFLYTYKYNILVLGMIYLVGPLSNNLKFWLIWGFNMVSEL